MRVTRPCSLLSSSNGQVTPGFRRLLPRRNGGLATLGLMVPLVVLASVGGDANPALAQAARVVPSSAQPGEVQPGATQPGPTRQGTTRQGATEASGIKIVAVVNGDVISNVDVDDRARLFALSTGQPLTPEVLDRLRPQIRSQLVDERLRIQEVQRRHIIIQDKQIADAIRSIEGRNNLPAGALRQKLASDGIGLRTLVDQIRTQLGWLQVVRQQLGTQVEVAPSAVAERQRILQLQTGKPEFLVAEIFIPIDDPSSTADAQRFADTVITELRAGAPFPTVASQFSQSQAALQGGELGWVQPNDLDPQVARVVTEMPQGAVSNPIKVPGGLAIVTVQGKREIGHDIGTVVTLRQLFLPFTSPLNPQEPTAQQRQTLDKARAVSASVHSCEQMEASAKANPSPRSLDPGEVRLDHVNPPPFRQMLQTIPIGQASQPLVAADGISVLVVCTREEKNMATVDTSALRDQIVEERAELAARQLQQSLRHQATIELRSSGA